ncbi:hypothetical protein BH09ACT6_BH09ACT6_15190 [soil metagenome]
MPTYSYRCTECENAFDIQQSFTDDSLTVCPVCGGKLRKVFSPVGITFNGSGFYRNDSRAAKSSSEGPKKTEGGSSEGSKKSEGSTSEGSKTSDSTKKSDGASSGGSSSSASTSSPTSSSASK